MSSACREVLITRVLDATPDHRVEFPASSVWPFVTAVCIGAMFVMSLFTPWSAVIAGVPATVALVLWFWPKPSDHATPRTP